MVVWSAQATATTTAPSSAVTTGRSPTMIPVFGPPTRLATRKSSLSHDDRRTLSNCLKGMSSGPASCTYRHLASDRSSRQSTQPRATYDHGHMSCPLLGVQLLQPTALQEHPDLLPRLDDDSKTLRSARLLLMPLVPYSFDAGLSPAARGI